MKYRNVYWSKEALDMDHTTADILAIGDSWFWYPYPGGSLIQRIGDLMTNQHNILVAGYNGAEVYDYVKGKYKRQVNEMLRLYGSTASAVLVSGGGNDFAGFSDLRPLLESDCSAAASADACFGPGNAEGKLQWLMERMLDNCTLLISRILLVAPPHARVLLHCYDYAVPDGRGIYHGGNAWLKPALDDARVPVALHRDCIKLLIDAMHSVMTRLVANYNGRVVLVDSRNTLVHDDWANELHPREQGFRKIADTRWQPALSQLGLC